MLNRNRRMSLWLTGAGILFLLALPACQSPGGTPTPAPTENTYGLSREAFETLMSLEQVDEYPLYIMHYSGGYESPAAAARQEAVSFSCSLFAALGDPDQLLYGRNLDWSYSPALLLYTDPPDGYASVSMVDLSYTGLGTQALSGLLELPPPERIPLLGTVAFPFDGMNEYGLAIGIAAVNESIADMDPTRATIGSLVIIREVLDHARNSEEALAIFSRYNIDFSGGPPLHYLIADSEGRSVLIEYILGEQVVLPGEQAWQVATNHLVGTGLRGGGGSGWRYDILEERLRTSGGDLTPAEAMDLLADVSQRINNNTQWSVIYELNRGSIQIAMGRNYDSVHEFQLPLAVP